MNAPAKLPTTLGASSPREKRDWQTVRLFDLKNDREFASTWFQDGYYASSAGWHWIKKSVAEKFECDEDDVDCIETDDGDRITVKGVAVAYEGRDR